MSPASTIDSGIPADLPVHIEVRRLLGREGNTRLYEARQLDFDRRIVLRVSELRETTFGNDKGRAEQVIARLGKLEHPGVCKLWGGSVQGETVFLETEPPRGRLLESFLKERRLTDAQRISLALRAGEALAYLHGQGIGYGELLNHGVRVARGLGSLELEPKLVRLETLRTLKTDGSDQRAFATLIAKLSGEPSSGRTNVQDALATLGEECAATTDDSPTFANLVLRLRELAAERQKSQAIVGYHCAEPAEVKTLRPPSKPNTAKKPNYLTRALATLGAAVAIISLLVGLSDRDRTTRRNASRPSRSATASTPFTFPSEPSDSPAERVLPRRVTQRPQPFARPERKYTFVPDSPRTRLPNLEGTGFAVPRTMQGGTTPGEVDEQYQLSNGKWEGGFGAEMEFSVDYSGPGESFASPTRMLWIVESEDGTRYRAHLTGGLQASGSLCGNTAFLRDVRFPVQTYLAEETFPRGDQPKRISNIMTIDSSTNE